MIISATTFEKELQYITKHQVLSPVYCRRIFVVVALCNSNDTMLGGRRGSVDVDYILPAAFSVYDIDPPAVMRRSTHPKASKCIKCARFQALIKLYQVNDSRLSFSIDSRLYFTSYGAGLCMFCLTQLWRYLCVQ